MKLTQPSSCFRYAVCFLQSAYHEFHIRSFFNTTQTARTEALQQCAKHPSIG
eukprot:jgi/Psemu1/316538/fgenesh1_kg.3531_\